MVSVGHRQLSKLEVNEKATSDEVCQFCQKHGDPNDPAIGPVFSKDGVLVHKNCLYFCAGIAQVSTGSNEDSEDTLFFFKLDDIRKEWRRSRLIKCVYCGLKCAASGCNKKRCKMTFHYPCGLLNEVQFNYQKFSSHCRADSETQPPLTEELSDDVHCNICFDKMDPSPTYSNVYCPSCKRWVHRDCLQNWAYKAGLHHLRCPMCNNEKVFRKEMLRIGFELPDRDAEWEIEGMYREQEDGVLLTCHAEECYCPKGREYSAKTGPQELIVCRTCGFAAAHRTCAHKEWRIKLDSAGDWECDDCDKAEQKARAIGFWIEKLRQQYPDKVIPACEGKKSTDSNVVMNTGPRVPVKPVVDMKQENNDFYTYVGSSSTSDNAVITIEKDNSGNTILCLDDDSNSRSSSIKENGCQKRNGDVVKFPQPSFSSVETVEPDLKKPRLFPLFYTKK